MYLDILNSNLSISAYLQSRLALHLTLNKTRRTIFINCFFLVTKIFKTCKDRFLS